MKLCAHTFCMQLHSFDTCLDLRMRASSSSWGSSPMSFLTQNTCHHGFFFLLYISFVNIVTKLTQHWYTWNHAACMCMANPRRSTPGLIVPMYAVVESGYLPYTLAINIHHTVLYCLCIPFPFVYFIDFLIIFIHSIITVM